MVKQAFKGFKENWTVAFVDGFIYALEPNIIRKENRNFPTLQPRVHSFPISRNNIAAFKESDILPARVAGIGDINDFRIGRIEAQMNNSFSLFDYQRECVTRQIKVKWSINATTMGGGKTLMALAHIVDSLHENPTKAVLVFAPKRIISQWLRQFELFFPEFAKLSIVVTGTAKKQERILKRSGKQIFIMSIATLNTPRLTTLLAFDKSMIVLDEASKVKNYKTKISANFKEIIRGVENVLLLSGTPFENSVGEFYQIYKNILAVNLGGWFTFSQNYEPITQIGGLVLKTKVAHRTVQARTEDVQKNMPEIILTIEEVQMLDWEEEIYRMLEKEWGMIDLNDLADEMEIKTDHINESDYVVDGPQVVKLLRLQQATLDPIVILNSIEKMMGDLYERGKKMLNTSLRKKSNPNSGKTQRVLDLCKEFEQRGEQAIVFTKYRQYADVLMKALEKAHPGKVCMIAGGMNAKSRRKVDEAFLVNKTATILIGTMAIAYGFDAPDVTNVIVCDNHYNPAVLEQQLDRIKRAGQTGLKFAYVLVSKHPTIFTADEIVLKIQERKNKQRRLVAYMGIETDRFIKRAKTDVLRI